MHHLDRGGRLSGNCGLDEPREGGGFIHNTGDQEQRGASQGPRGSLSGGPRNSPGSRSGLSPDRGCRETPGTSCPGAPGFRSREGTPRPPFLSVRPGFSAGEICNEK